MTSKANRTRIREAFLANTTNDSDQSISEDDDSTSDLPNSVSETESDDTSTDEYISHEDDSTDSDTNDSDKEDTPPKNQPESVGKGGVVWSIQVSEARGHFRA
jgi:hypothetical protein